jgi:DNA topoisomerase VI subunit B
MADIRSYKKEVRTWTMKKATLHQSTLDATIDAIERDFTKTLANVARRLQRSLIARYREKIDKYREQFIAACDKKLGKSAPIAKQRGGYNVKNKHDDASDTSSVLSELEKLEN